MANQNFEYNEKFTFSIVELKGDKKYYVEGFISTADADLSDEVLTEKAQDTIVQQCLDRVITMDVEHEEFYDANGKVTSRPNNVKIPVAKIVHAERRDNGVWVKVEINKDSDRFDNIWNSIKNDFLHSFSVAFYPLSAITKKVGDKFLRFIDDLSLINVTLTGSPVNPNARFAPVMKAALKALPNEGENKMSEEIKQEAPVVEAKPVEAPVVEQVAPGVEPVAEAAPVAAVEPVVEVKAEKEEKDEKEEELTLASLHKALKSLKSEFDAYKSKGNSDAVSPKDENQVQEANEKSLSALGGQNPNVKAVSELDKELESLRAENAALKAQLDEPVMKGLGPQIDAIKQERLKAIAENQTQKITSVLDMIR